MGAPTPIPARAGGSSRGRTREQTPRFLGPLLTGKQRQTGVPCPSGRVPVQSGVWVRGWTRGGPRPPPLCGRRVGR